MPSDSMIDRFWERFNAVAPRLEHDPADEGALVALDDAVGALGPYDWEIGPRGGTTLVIALSPGGDPGRLVETTAVVARAPVRPGWVFLPALPAKEWTGELVLGKGTDGVTFRTSGWLAVLHEYPDGKMEIDVYAPELGELTTEDAGIATRLAVMSWIGEELFIERVLCVKPVPQRLPERGIPLSVLGSMLARG